MPTEANRVPVRIERSAGGVVVRLVAGGWHALLIRDPGGNWSLPKGHIEEGETLRDTAAREVEEETGIRPDAVGPRLDTVDWLFRRRSGLVHKYCTFFLMRSRSGRPTPQRSEGISACEWFPLPDAADRIPYQDTSRVVRRVLTEIPATGW